MKHSNFTAQFKQLEDKLYEELYWAVKAHSGVYTFIRLDEDGNVIDEDEEENAPRVIGSVGWWDESRGIVVSRIEVDDSDHYIRFYGWPTDPGWSCDERRIDDIEIRDLDFIIDCIPETDEVSDVTLK